MNKLNKYLLIILVALTSCAISGPELPLWLEGEWKTNNRSGFLGENWKQVNDTLLSGKGLVHAGGQVQVMEEIDIFVSNNQLYYGVRVLEQNEAEMILFKASLAKPGRLVFNNPGHDFPTKIEYIQKGDSLFAHISGPGGQESRTFEMIKK